MTTWVGDDEYKQIKASWRFAGKNGARQFDYGTARENLDRCHGNLRAAAREAGELRDLWDRLPPGDTRRLSHKDSEGNEVLSIEERIRKNRAEQAHWRSYVDYYQGLAAKEPQPRRPTDPIPADMRPMKTREPGADDVELPLPPDPRLPREEDPEDVGTGA